MPAWWPLPDCPPARLAWILLAAVLESVLWRLARRPAHLRPGPQWRRLPWGVIAGWPGALMVLGPRIAGVRVARWFFAVKDRRRWRPLFSERNQRGYRTLATCRTWEFGVRIDSHTPRLVQGR